MKEKEERGERSLNILALEKKEKMRKGERERKLSLKQAHPLNDRVRFLMNQQNIKCKAAELDMFVRVCTVLKAKIQSDHM